MIYFYFIGWHVVVWQGWYLDVGPCLLLFGIRVEMSLSFFAVKNQWHKNGSNQLTQVFGGSPKYSTAPWAKNDITPSESPEGFSQTNSTTSGSTCFTGCSWKALMWLACWESTPKWTQVMDMALTVTIFWCSSIWNVQRFPGKHYKQWRIFRNVGGGGQRDILHSLFVFILHPLLLEQECYSQERGGAEDEDERCAQFNDYRGQLWFPVHRVGFQPSQCPFLQASYAWCFPAPRRRQVHGLWYSQPQKQV